MAGKRQKHHEEGHENHERWLLTYADLITLLMVFFVVMYSLGRADVAKFARLQAALQRAFNTEVLKGSVPTSLKGQDGAGDPNSVLDGGSSQPQEPATPGELVSTVEDLQRALKQLPAPVQARAQVAVGATTDGVVISLAGNVLFDSGKADLRPEGLKLLDTLVPRLRMMPNDLRIEGHTDDTPINTPLYPSNWELSSARATSVARYFIERGGIGPARLTAAGYGEYRPAAPNTTREGRARNRRVDIVILNGPPAATTAGMSPLSQRGGLQ
ncbi:MAG TPA: flagellar motor protein MotB [Chloroflexota bacterium]